jgi:hypothetical protein
LLNIRCDKRGKMVGDPSFGLSERPIGVPNWPNSLFSAQGLEDSIKAGGLHDEFIRNLKAVMGDSIEAASARQMSEAALMTFRDNSTCVA